MGTFAYVVNVVEYLASHPLVLLALFLLYLLIFTVSIVWAPHKSGKNPFKHDEIKSPQPQVIDKNLREKVLKLGFKSELVPRQLDVIVIGSGIGGLATAAMLSKSGKKVLVLEQHDQAGGCCHTFTEDGFEFDIGIHYIGGMGEKSQNKFFIDQISNGQIQWMKMDNIVDEVYVGSKDDEHIRKYTVQLGTYNLFKQNLLKMFPSEKEAIEKFIDLLKSVKDKFIVMALFKVLPRWLIKLLVKTRIIYASSYFKIANKSLDEVIDGLTNNADLKAVLSYNYANYGVQPSRSSFLLHALMINHYMGGAYYPKGGASELAFNIIPVIEAAGGKVLVRAMVKEIIIEDGKAVGVRLERSDASIEIRATTVISDAGFYNTFKKMLPREVAEKSDAFHLLDDKIRVGTSTMSMFVGLNGSSQDLGLKSQNIWLLSSSKISKEVEENLERSLDEALDSEVPFVFLSSPSARDPTYEARHPGKSGLTILAHANWKWFEGWQSERVKHRGDGYKIKKDVFMEKIWRHVLNIYPQLEEKVKFRDLGTCLSNNFYLNSVEGEIYGLDHPKERFSDPDLLTHLRPDTGIPGLFMTGQDVLCCGLMGAATGAILTTSVVLNRNVYSDLLRLFKQGARREGWNELKKDE